MDGSIAGASVVRAIAIDALDWSINLSELTRQGARINDIGIRQQRHDELLGVGIQADVELAPAAAIILTVRADFPLAFAEDFQSGGIEDEVFDGFLRWRSESDLETTSAAAKQRVMRGG